MRTAHAALSVLIAAATCTLHATSHLDAGIATLILINIASASTLVPYRSAFAFALIAGLSLKWSTPMKESTAS